MASGRPDLPSWTMSSTTGTCQACGGWWCCSPIFSQGHLYFQTIQSLRPIRYGFPCQRLVWWMWWGTTKCLWIFSPLQMWGHFLPGRRYSPALLNHQTGNLREGHKLPQSKAARPWGSCNFFWAYPGRPEMRLSPGMLDGFSGPTEVVIYSTCAYLLWKVVVLATAIQGPIDAGW